MLKETLWPVSPDSINGPRQAYGIVGIKPDPLNLSSQNMIIPKITQIYYDESKKECLLVDKLNNLIYFDDITAIDWGGNVFWVDWVNSGPSGPWSRGTTDLIVKVGPLPAAYEKDGEEYVYCGSTTRLSDYKSVSRLQKLPNREEILVDREKDMEKYEMILTNPPPVIPLLSGEPEWFKKPKIVPQWTTDTVPKIVVSEVGLIHKIIEFFQTRQKRKVEQEIARLTSLIDSWENVGYTTLDIHANITGLKSKKASLIVKLQYLNK